MGEADIRRFPLEQPGKLDAAKGCDIGNGEAVAGDKGLRRQPVVQPAYFLGEFAELRFAKLSELRLFKRRESWVSMTDSVGNRG